MGKTLYVGNLGFSVTEDELRSLFQEAGTVESATIGFNAPSGKARGFGFVKMASEEDALRAISLLHGREYEGRRLNVREPQEPHGGPRFRRGGIPRRGTLPPKTNL